MIKEELENRAIIFIHANMTRDNFTVNFPQGEYFSVYIENRTKLVIKQTATSYQTNYNALFWFDYVYLP